MTIGTSAWNLYTMSPIYIVYYNGTDYIVFEDRHEGASKSMSASVHNYLHYTVGT